MLKSSRLMPNGLDRNISCVLPCTGLLQPCIAALAGLGKLLGMNKGGGLLGVVCALAHCCARFFPGVLCVTSSSVVA